MEDMYAKDSELVQVQEENARLLQKQQEMQLRLSHMECRSQMLQQKLQLAEYWSTQMQAKYTNLAQSKLGRLTLRLWNLRTRLHATKLRGGKWFFLRWLFDRKFRSASMDTPKMLEMGRTQQNWIDGYFERLITIPNSNGCRFYQKIRQRIGIICDEFFYESICDAADFILITPENWQESLDNGLDTMLFVTAWRGVHGEWRGLGTVQDMDRNPMRQLALNILDSCKEKGIPTVFYSKEDPPNFEVFVEYARHCDYVCTTAQECIPRYQNECGHERIQAVCFGVNPVKHNPIGLRSNNKEDTVLFSGSWMMKYPDRCRELEMIFDGVLESEYNLHIVDRNYPSNPKYCFPEKYFTYTSPALPHELLQKVHKLFDWAVNINSVKGSYTMFANRAFELQANGVLLLSNLSLGVNKLLPTVQMVVDQGEVTRILNGLTDEERYARQIVGIRAVMTGHTCFDRLEQILKPLNMDASQPERKILVLVDEMTEEAANCFNRQSYSEKTMMTASEATDEVLKQFDMVTWFSTCDGYGTFYLEDMINGFKYTNCDYITKDAWCEGDDLHQGIEHNYVNYMRSKYRTVFWRDAFSTQFLMSLDGEVPLENGYSIDHFQYHAAPASSDDNKNGYAVSVVIPVSDSGLHLYAKSVASLRRSSMFENMEILLITDSSTGERTLQIVSDLADTFSNVRVQNCCTDAVYEGLSMAVAPYVALLMPENESIGDGLARMYETAEREQADIVIGSFYTADTEAVLTQPPEALDGGQLSRILTENPFAKQAMLCRKSVVANILDSVDPIEAVIRNADTPVLICYTASR